MKLPRFLSLLNLFFPHSRFSVLFSGLSLCYLPHFAPTASRKNEQPKIFSSHRAQCETLRKPTEVNSPSADWLSYLRTQLTAFLREVCLRSRKIFSALFSQNNFFTKRRHFKELQVKENLFDCSQILTVAGFTYKQQKHVSECFISKYFFFKNDFCPINPHFLNPISKMFCNFSLKLNMANRRHIFLAHWPRKRRNTLNKPKPKFALTGNAQKVIWVLAFRSREKFDNSFFSKFLE